MTTSPSLRYLVTNAAIIWAGFGIAATASAHEFQIDPAQSKLHWVGSKVTGSEHSGTVAIESGALSFEKNLITAGKVVVDMTTIKNEDLKEAEWNQKLVNHLNSKDFFDVESFKKAELKILKSQILSEGQYQVDAELTIKGVTKPVQFTAKADTKDKQIKNFNADVVFDRTTFGIQYNSGKFFQNLGDKMISDSVKITVDLVLKQPIKLSQN